MNNLTNSLQIRTLDGTATRAPAHIVRAIETASTETGVDFSYLLKQASVESSFKADAKSKSSSATGLYQFIDSTWLDMMDRYGEDFGIDTEGKSRKEILALRKDPETASFMAAAFASENEKSLNTNWGGDVGATELYFAHFMGANGAASFLNARDENPLQTAADIFPKAAKANRNVFYDRETGNARTLEQVYQFFAAKFAPAESQETQDKAVAVAKAQTPDENLFRSFTSNKLSDSVVMQRSAAMRRESEDGYTGNTTAYGRNRQESSVFTKRDENASPFFSLVSRPVDVMLLTQTVTPSKVVRDNT